MSCFSLSERKVRPLCTSSTSGPMQVIKVATQNPLSFSFSFVTVLQVSQTCFHFFHFSERFSFISSRPGGGTLVVQVRAVIFAALNQRSPIQAAEAFPNFFVLQVAREGFRSSKTIKKKTSDTMLQFQSNKLSQGSWNLEIQQNKGSSALNNLQAK